MNITMESVSRTIEWYWQDALQKNDIHVWFTVAARVNTIWDLMLESCDNLDDIRELLESVRILKMMAYQMA